MGKNVTTVVLKGNVTLESGSILIRKGGILILESDTPLKISGDLKLESAAVLTHAMNSDFLLNLIDFTAKNIYQEQGAHIDADGKGYAGGVPKKAGQGKAGGAYAKQGSGAGGSYGGHGGDAKGRKNISLSYGEIRKPEELGSGGSGGKATRGGAGGGLIKLTAENEFLISGKITANGSDGEADRTGEFDAGGGAGGSIYLTANTFGGEGAEILAHGGNAHKSGGGGSGGRIYVKGNSGEIKGTLNVNGGEGFEKGEAGSVVFE